MVEMRAGRRNKGAGSVDPDPRPHARRRLAAALGGPPEAFERPAIGRLAQLLERPLANLADPFARDAHQRPDLFERHRFSPLFDPVVQSPTLAFPPRQVLLDAPA